MNNSWHIIRIAKSVINDFSKTSILILITVAILSILGPICAAVAPLLFTRGLDVLNNDSLKESAAFTFLIYYAIVSGLAAGASQCARYLNALCVERLSLSFNIIFFRSVVRKKPAFYSKNNATNIEYARNAASQTISILFQLIFSGLVPGIVQVLASLVILGSILSWDLVLVVSAFGILVVSIDIFHIGRVRQYIDTAIFKSGDNARFISDVISVVETIQHTKSEEWVEKKYTENSIAACNAWRSFGFVSSSYALLGSSLLCLQLCLVFYLVIPKYYAGLVTVGQIVLFNLIVIQLNQPFHMIGGAIKELVEAASRFSPALRILTSPEWNEAAGSIKYTSREGFLEFKNVTYVHSSGSGVRNLSFSASRGLLTYIVGPSGSGKTTVLRLLLKSLEPQSGRIEVDGLDLELVGRGVWYNQVGVVPQEIVLFNDTIAANIVLGRSFDIDRLREASERASILTKIESLPLSFETLVGERGLNLSGGERQRIAIARCLYANPSILVLDEASAALDEATECAIMDGLRSHAENLTIVSVTHRAASIRPGDCVINL